MKNYFSGKNNICFYRRGVGQKRRKGRSIFVNQKCFCTFATYKE